MCTNNRRLMELHERTRQEEKPTVGAAALIQVAEEAGLTVLPMFATPQGVSISRTPEILAELYVLWTFRETKAYAVPADGHGPRWVSLSTARRRIAEMAG